MSVSLLKKVQQRSVERKFGGTHPVLRMGLDRNAVDAYFTGLVFAAVADDEAIDEYERQKLLRVGSALNISEEDVRTIMSDMLARDSDAKVAIAEECANVLKGSPSIPLFVCEWSQVWMSHVYRQEELDEFRVQLCEWLGIECDTDFCSAFDVISSGAAIDEAMLHRLTDKISEDDLLYLCSDKADEIKRILDAERARKEHEEKARKEREAAELRAKEAKHREEQEKIKEATAIRNSYNTLVAFADECIKLYGKKFSRTIFLELREMWVRYGYPSVDMQKLFFEIGQRFVSRIEALNISYSSKLSRFGSKLTSFVIYAEERNSYTGQFAVQISLQTVWMLIALGSQRVEPEQIAVKNVVELLSLASQSDCHSPSDVSILWCDDDCGEASCEALFCPLLGVNPVWKDLSFNITDEQRAKIRAWMNGRKSFKPVELKEYVSSIGVSPYVDGAILMSIVRGKR